MSDHVNRVQDALRGAALDTADAFIREVGGRDIDGVSITASELRSFAVRVGFAAGLHALAIDAKLRVEARTVPGEIRTPTPTAPEGAGDTDP